ncbi:hypothetical protein BDY19DRAFT_940730 [Irpex rosettiformis]|uniref:Uncharacterized protein n=1 Tax=Irpex rosettiformis TaxID=378272 RepID=A0ACB8U684_9APHY|nr:hypothetical protein BDY19DRAFT_940730 [Irpex rosettiformis]
MPLLLQFYIHQESRPLRPLMQTISPGDIHGDMDCWYKCSSIQISSGGKRIMVNAFETSSNCMRTST